MLYHYTPAYRAVMIIRSGILQPSTVGLIESDTPYIWFSSNDKGDQTATHGSKTIAAVLGKPATRHVRFTYTGNDAMPYASLKMRYHHRKTLEKKANGSIPSQWYGLTGSLPIERLTLQDCKNGQWETINSDKLISEFNHVELSLFDGKVAFRLIETNL